MSKRRRTSSIASRQTDDDFDDSIDAPTVSAGPSGRKRKKLDPTELCQQLYDVVRNHKKEDGTLLCDAFIRVPKRRQEPTYYEVVTNPIDLLKVQQKLKTDEYEDMDDLTTDIELLVNNAKAFYKRNSQEFRDACDFWELFISTKNRLLDIEENESKGKIILKVGKLARRAAAAAEARKQETIILDEDTSESSTNPDDDILNQFEDLFTAVMMATDADNRPLHTEFQLLPSKKKYPEYYEVIEQPIDLKNIATKIQNTEYTSLIDLEKDLLLMTKNACLFNEPGSKIYKDAKTLKKVISSKKIEVEHGKFVSGKSSERIRNKRLRGVQSLSAVTAALRDEETDTDIDDTMDIEEEEEEVEDVDNPQWQLLDAVKCLTNNAGMQISEPFWKLPSKRYYPDYYKEIKNPISLSQIKKKMKKGDYGTVSEVAGDMNIMFENAKKYNVHTSKLYKDALKLQKVMQSKVQELLDIDQVTHKATNRALKVKDTDSDADSEDSRRRRSTKPRVSTPQGRGRLSKEMLPLKKRLHTLSKRLVEYTCEDGRQPMLVFMEKPSKKLYPDYYQVIHEPIDLITIESKIKNDQYSSEEELINDFKLMFANCRQYNEEHSTIYEDANILEKVLMDKVKDMTPTIVERKPIIKIVKPKRILTITEQKCRTLYDAIRDYREPKNNRQLALIFMKLPSKLDYPDYYEVIKNPIDMEKISFKLKNFVYTTLEEIVSDFILMFDNACKYNEPDSQIYKDALILQRVCLQTKLQLCEDEEAVPDVQGAVQDMLSSLFTSVYNHQDEEGRCYSDSMAELAEHDDVDGKKIRALSFDLIKRRLDRSMYRRLDTFQEDIFNCLERARRLSRTDSQIFEDSVELQTYFIQQRDEICRNGDWFSSPALSYTLMHLTAAVEANKQNKLIQESLDDDNETSRNSDDSNLKETNPNPGESMIYNQQTYRVGEFIYVDSKEKGMEPSILRIERLWTNNGQQMLYGKFFVRPSETYHVATRKFLEKEVFMSDTHIAVPLDEVKGRCCVMSIKDYMKMRPEGYAEKDVYVCESRYSSRTRTFKKILKIWPADSELVFIPREQLLELRRVMSVFRDRIEKHKDELAELEEQEKIIEKEKPNVEVFTANVDPNADEGNTYYEQYNTICSGVVKTGDCVYVATDGGRQLIAQIDTIWDTKDGKAYFRGPWLVTPPEIPHSPNRLFYKQEVFLSTLEDTNPLVGIVGKCAVLDYNDYISSRPTEVPEVDVFICESVYDEVTRQTRKLSEEGLKKYAHNNAVTEDEIYYFKRLINAPKSGVSMMAALNVLQVGSEIAQLQPEIIKPQPVPLIEVEIASPIIQKLTDVDILLEDSLDGGPPSVSSVDIPAPIGITPGISVATPVSSKKKGNSRKLVTGYILYSSEVRRQVVQNNPESTFGEISRIVGNEWRSLPAGEKQAWEEKAAICNVETAAKIGAEGEHCASPAPPILQLAPLPDQIYECCWDSCDYQFEEITDCIDHCIQEGHGHVQAHFLNIPSSEAEYQCHWRGCGRLKKSMPPFPALARLARHVREVHINKGNGKIVPPSDRSKNFVVSSRHQYTATVKPTVGTNANAANSSPVVAVKPQEPLFVAVPPRPQRVLHSEAYIKYIEGLQVDNKFITPWEKTLVSTNDNTPAPDADKIAALASWLPNGVGNHGSVLNALWTLRDYMVKDSLNIYKNL